MKSQQTGLNFYYAVKKFLILLGKPLLTGILHFLFILLVISSSTLRLSIQLIKLLNSAKLKISHRVKNLTNTSFRFLIKEIHKTSSFVNRFFKYTFQIPPIKYPIIQTPPKWKKLTIIISLLTITASSITIATLTIIKNLPNPDNLITRNQKVSTKIYDRNGKLLYKIFKSENRTIVKLNDIPSHLIQATIAVEDKDFYKHPGYSYTGILRALKQTIFEKKLQGGSTITQQLVKNALLTQEKTLKRKIKELILAIIVETKFSKDEILTMYFNEVGYGGASYGAAAAAEMYFNKSINKLSLAEAALIAGLPAAPTYNSPFGTHPELAKLRQHKVLRRMIEDKYISAEQAEKAKQEKLVFAAPKTDIKAPHFVMYVKELLVEKFGEQMVEQGGLEVTTTLDLDIQNFAQQTATEEVNSLSMLNITNAAVLITSPKTGEILAMVGSKNFFDFKNDGQVNVTLRPRQPGSAIKPINYAVALENGFTAATILNDSPVTYHIPAQPPYSPKNYDNTFHGKITLREALANSYNVPAVKTLSVFGVEKMIDKGQQMGITTWQDKSKYGLSLTLGGGEIKMTDLAVAYGTLANHGLRTDLSSIINIKNYRGETLYQNPCNKQEQKNFQSPLTQDKTCQTKKALSAEIAFILSDILSDNQARSRAFGSHSLLQIPNHQVAVKTGTTQNLRDNWTIGYTQDILVATWVGNNDNTPMSYVASGITGASPIWNKIISALLSNLKQPHKFQPPKTLITKTICPSTGTLPCEGCPGKPEYFILGSEPTTKCTPFTEEQKNNPITQKSNSTTSNTPQQTLAKKKLDKLSNKSSARKSPGRRSKKIP